MSAILLNIKKIVWAMSYKAEEVVLMYIDTLLWYNLNRKALSTKKIQLITCGNFSCKSTRNNKLTISKISFFIASLSDSNKYLIKK